MKQKKIPMRTCVVTREKYPKQELIRIVRTTDGTIEIDKTGKVNGRGAYLKLEEAVINLAKKSKILEKILTSPIPDIIFDELLLILQDL